jgi:hypothetical protein
LLVLLELLLMLDDLLFELELLVDSFLQPLLLFGEL